MGLADWEKCCEKIAKYQEKCGRAAQGRIQGQSVLVDGKFYPFDVAVPITIVDGKSVWVHISDNRAVVIGD